MQKTFMQNWPGANSNATAPQYVTNSPFEGDNCLGNRQLQLYFWNRSLLFDEVLKST